MSVHPAKRQKPVEARIAAECNAWLDGEVVATSDDAAGLCRITCSPPRLQELCEWLDVEMGYTLATLVVEETPDSTLTLTYVLYPATTAPWVYVELSIDALNAIVPSLAGLTRGPSVDWHEREAEDLFGLHFEGHPRLGEFVLHEDWPEGINPMRRSFDARQRFALREREPAWQPPTVLQAPGGFSMPVGPVFSDFAEAAHFLLETVGEEVIRTIPRFFYKFRGVEKIAEGQSVDRVLLLAERFSGTSAFAHALAFSQAVETICEIAVPPPARALRTVFAELERLRHHAATITSICNSTALAVATAQASLIEEDLLRLSAAVGRHRYLFALVEPGGVARDQSEEEVRHLATIVAGIAARLEDLHGMLRYSSSFLDRLEEVGMISAEEAISYGLVGPVARAAGLACDMRKLRPYAAYETMDFAIPVEPEGDGYARLRIFFREAALSAAMIDQILPRMPSGRSALTASSGVPAPRWARWRRRRAPLSIGCGSAKAARCSATASPLRLLPTGTPSISLRRTSRSKTSPSSLPALGCRTPSAIASRWSAIGTDFRRSTCRHQEQRLSTRLPWVRPWCFSPRGIGAAGIALIAALYCKLGFKGPLGGGGGGTVCDLDRLGGARRMPWTSFFWWAVSSLLPLTGCQVGGGGWRRRSHSTPIKITFEFRARCGLTGTGVTCSKVFAMGFLGMARSDGAAQAVEVRFGTRVPMALLAVACVALGVLPTYTISVLDRAAAPLAHASSTAALVPPFFSPILQQRENVPPAFLTEFHDLGSQTGSGILPGRGLVVLHRGEASNPVVFRCRPRICLPRWRAC